MSDAHIALFQLDSTSGSRIIAMALPSLGSTDVAKLASISACLVLAEDVSRSFLRYSILRQLLPHRLRYPLHRLADSLLRSEAFSSFAPFVPLEKCIADFVKQEYSSPSQDIDHNLGHGRRGSSRTSIRALPTDAHSTRAELLRSILKVWTARPELSTITSVSPDLDTATDASPPSQLFDSLASLLADSNLQGSACKVLLELLRLERSLGVVSFGPTSVLSLRCRRRN